MNKQDELTQSELDTMIGVYQSLLNIVVFFAGFVFVTIPLVIFSIETSSTYGKLIIYTLLAAFLAFTLTIDQYHSTMLQTCQETIPKAYRTIREKRGTIIGERSMGIGIFLAFSSLGFMLLLKGPEWTIEAIIWLLISIGLISRYFWGLYKTHKDLRQRLSRAEGGVSAH